MPKSSALKTAGIAVATAGVAIGAAASLVASILLLKRFRVKSSCADFYEQASIPFQIPGLNHGFVPQDMAYLADEKIWLFSGYIDYIKPSPIYKLLPDGTSQKIIVQLPDGSLYKGHGAAVAANDRYAFLTVKDGYVVIDRQQLIDAGDGGLVKAFAHVPVELEPAFMTIQEGSFYIGEFYHRIYYPTPKSHWRRTASGAWNQAFIYEYRPSPDGQFGYEGQAFRTFSIPKNVQGMVELPDGRMILSCSFGTVDSHLLFYDLNKAQTHESINVDGHQCPLYMLDETCLIEKMTVPPMAEGIYAVGNRIYLANESASFRYLIGRTFGGRNVYSFEV